MQAILGLVPHHALRAIEHLGGDFFTAVRGQTMQEDGVRCRQCHEWRVDLIQRKSEGTLRLLLLLPHRGPHVGGHHVGAGRSLARIAQQVHHPRRHASAQEIVVGIVSLRTRQLEGEAQMRGRFNPRVGHVVAVTDPGDRLPADVAQVLLDGEDIGQDLAGMGQIGEAVDDGHLGILGQRFHVRVCEGPDHDPVHVSVEHPGRIGNGLTTTQLDIARREKVRGATQLGDPDLERHAGTRRRLHENHGQRLAQQRLTIVGAGAHTLGQIEQGERLRRGEVGDVQEIAMRRMMMRHPIKTMEATRRDQAFSRPGRRRARGCTSEGPHPR